MAEKRIGIIMHGVTGRMGMNQHLIRSILEIRKQGGVALKDGTRLMPDPLLVGRNAGKVEELARKHGVARWTTDLDAALAGKDEIFFDAASTQLRPRLLKRADSSPAPRSANTARQRSDACKPRNTELGSDFIISDFRFLISDYDSIAVDLGQPAVIITGHLQSNVCRLQSEI